MIAKKIYPAHRAGLQVATSSTFKGLEFEYSGYNEKINLLIDTTTREFRNIVDDIDEAVFEMQKAEMKKNFGNRLLSAETLELDYSTKVLRQDYWTSLEYFRAIDEVAIEEMQKFMLKFFRQMKIQVLVQGNITKSQAMEILATLQKNLECDALDEVI